MQQNKFLCRNRKTKISLSILATDGQEVRKSLNQLFGAMIWSGKKELSWPNSWEIELYCDCGKTQATRFCSSSCFQKAEGEIKLMECSECGDLLPTSNFYHPTNSLPQCKGCVDGFWEMMGDDPCGKGWGP